MYQQNPWAVTPNRVLALFLCKGFPLFICPMAEDPGLSSIPRWVSPKHLRV